MGEIQKYDDAVEVIKAAILQSQYDAARTVNEKQLMLYYGIGKYISLNSRKGFWEKSAIDVISERLDKELPGLRGFTSRNLRYMRSFYEEWEMLDFNDQSEKTLENKSNHLELANSKLSYFLQSASVHRTDTTWAAPVHGTNIYMTTPALSLAGLRTGVDSTALFNQLKF